jgi:O-antigen/teichoic acid export membrane protein
VLLFQVLRSGGAVLLQLQQRFKALTLMSLPSAAVTMAASILLAQTSGPAGALAGLLAGECTLTALIWREIRHAASHRQQ